jgi:hypothetical protein
VIVIWSLCIMIKMFFITYVGLATVLYQFLFRQARNFYLMFALKLNFNYTIKTKIYMIPTVFQQSHGNWRDLNHWWIEWSIITRIMEKFFNQAYWSINVLLFLVEYQPMVTESVFFYHRPSPDMLVFGLCACRSIVLRSWDLFCPGMFLVYGRSTKCN